MSRLPARHGRDHVPNGYDPIPGVDGTVTPVVSTPPTNVHHTTIIDDSHFNAYPSIARAATGKLFCVYREGTDETSTDGKLTLQTSSDQGVTWSSKTYLASPAAGHDYRGIIACTSSGRLIIAYHDTNGSGAVVGLWTIVSDDDGVTWSSPASVSSEWSDWMSSGTMILQHSSGKLIWAVDGKESGNLRCGVLVSTDDGDTWGSFVEVAGDDYSEMSLVEDDLGRVHGFIRHEVDGDDIYRSISGDEAASWSSLVAMGFPAGPGRPMVARFQSSQTLLVFYRGPLSDGAKAFARYSFNFGTTWSDPEILYSASPYMYSGMCALLPNRVAVATSLRITITTNADIFFDVYQTGPATGGTGGAGPSPGGAAGGVLSGSYPDPDFAVDMATQAELNAHVSDTSDAHDASAISFSPTGTISSTDVQAAIAEVASEASGGGPAGGALDGTYPNPGLAASVAGAGLSESSDVLAVNVDGSTIEISSDALRVKDDGITAAKIAANAVTESEISLSDVTSDDVSTSQHGFVPKAPNDTAKFLRGDGSWATIGGTGTALVASDPIWDAVGDLAVGTGADAASRLAKGSDYDHLIVDASTSTDLRWVPGAPILLYDYTVAGSDKTSIDTGADTPDAGIAGTSAFPALRVLEVFFAHRTDDAIALPAPSIILNNDSGSNYDRQVIRGANATASAAQALGGTAWLYTAHGSGGAASFASSMELLIPNYAGGTFYKVGRLSALINDTTAGNNQTEQWAVTYRSTSAITRFKVTAPTSQKFKVGSRLMIYAR